MPWKAIRSVRRLLCLPLALALAAGPVAYADPGCDGGCSLWQCPPAFYHCVEGPPKIKFKCGCPRPVCGPCQLEHFGYYETCWRPWPFPPDWSHCPTPAVAAPMMPIPTEPPQMSPADGNGGGSPGSSLPAPRRVPPGL